MKQVFIIASMFIGMTASAQEVRTSWEKKLYSSPMGAVTLTEYDTGVHGYMFANTYNGAATYETIVFESKQKAIDFFTFVDKVVNTKGDVFQDITEYYPQEDHYKVYVKKQGNKITVVKGVGDYMSGTIFNKKRAANILKTLI